MATSAPSRNELERYRGAVTRYIQYLVRDATEAEDLTQETFVRAHRQRDTLRDPAALESWLYQIATRVSIDRMRQRAKAAQRQVDEPVEELPIADSAQPSPLTVIQQEEMSTCVQRYVAMLSDGYKAVLLLHDDGDLAVNRFRSCETRVRGEMGLADTFHRALPRAPVGPPRSCRFMPTALANP
jgi:RNA polymerase sigma factor (sigma-70 family)